MVTKTEVFRADVQAVKPISAKASPVFKPLKVGTRLAEELKLHLLKFTNTENELARCDFVSERLTDLCNAEGHLFSCCSLDISEVYENTLCSFGTEINLVLAVLCYTLEGLEHKIELANVRKIMSAAVRAGDIVLIDVCAQFLVAPACNICTVEVLDKLVGSVTCFTFTAVHKRVGEAAEMSRSNPCLRIHKNSRVKPYIIFVFLDKLLSPSVFDVCFKLYAEWTVVPCICKSAVDFASRIDKASALTKRNNLV